MAANHIICDKTKELPRNAIRYMQMLREAMMGLEQTRAAYLQARDGDGSLAAHYDLVATLGGYQAGDYVDANTAAKASFDELDSLYSKVATNGAVSSVRAAIEQAPAKHGV